jgi:hypothetical protein
MPPYCVGWVSLDAGDTMAGLLFQNLTARSPADPLHALNLTLLSLRRVAAAAARIPQDAAEEARNGA